MTADTPMREPWELPEQRSIPDMVAERIVEAMHSGLLAPGERIVEIQLAKRLGVSRGPLREAIKSLEAIHLLENRKGRGTVVAHIGPEQVLQMSAVRAVLQGLAARLVAGRRTPEMLRSLGAIHDQLVAAIEADQHKEWRDLVWRFHEAVCRASGNEFLLRSWLPLSNLVRIFLHQNPDYVRNTGLVVANHRRLMEALRSATPDEADAIFRSITLVGAYSRLDTEVPAELASVADTVPAAPGVREDPPPTTRSPKPKGSGRTRRQEAKDNGNEL